MPVTRSAAALMRKASRQAPYQLPLVAEEEDVKPLLPIWPASVRTTAPSPSPSLAGPRVQRMQVPKLVSESWMSGCDSVASRLSVPKQVGFVEPHVAHAAPTAMELDSPPAFETARPFLPPPLPFAVHHPLPPSPLLVPVPDERVHYLDWRPHPSYHPPAPIYHLPPQIPTLPPFHHLEQTPPTSQPELPPSANDRFHTAVDRLDCHSLLDLVENLIPTCSLPQLAFLSSPHFVSLAGLDALPSPMTVSPVERPSVPSTPPSATIPLFQSAELRTSPEGRAEIKLKPARSVSPETQERVGGHGYLRELVGLGFSFAK
ncbi:hypothetical protein JCM6882_001994 [Rhodosporidiobolus microsporus]